MLKTLDILIGVTTVLLIFSMAVTVITQAVTTFFDQRGKHLLTGLAGLVQLLGISSSDTAKQIAEAVLKHPAIAPAEGKLATVVHRYELTKLLMDLAGGKGTSTLAADAQTALQQMLKQNGVADPQQTLSNIRKMALWLETASPEIPAHMRQEIAVLQECATDYVAKLNTWFDQTIDRVSLAFTKHAYRVAIAASLVVVLAVQLDIIGVFDRLSIDDQFRNSVVTAAATDFSKTLPQIAGTASAPATGKKSPAAAASPAGDPSTAKLNTQHYYDLLSTAGMITLPTNHGWLDRLKDPRKYPGMVLAILLLSLGAPFWYNILKNLLGLRSALAQSDDMQRSQRKTGQAASDDDSSTPSSAASSAPVWKGEQGDLSSVG